MSIDDEKDNLDDSQIDLRLPAMYYHSQLPNVPLQPVSTKSVPEVVAAESGNEHGAEDGEVQVEAIQRLGLSAPYQPTQAEISNHSLTHLPYRSWCPICVKAKGNASGHRSVESHHNAGVSVISADYERSLYCLNHHHIR